MCECCYCCFSPTFCEQAGITCGLICGGVVVYMIGSVIIIETCQFCCHPYFHEECISTCEHYNETCKLYYVACVQNYCQKCCTLCKRVTRKKKNVVIKPVEVPSIHIMVRNPDTSFQLGTPCDYIT